MPTSDPTGRPGPEISASEQRNLEYLKGMAQAPMGWPAVPPTHETIDPGELREMLDRNPPDEPPIQKPWHTRPRTYVALLLFAALFLVIIRLI